MVEFPSQNIWQPFFHRTEHPKVIIFFFCELYPKVIIECPSLSYGGPRSVIKTTVPVPSSLFGAASFRRINMVITAKVFAKKKNHLPVILRYQNYETIHFPSIRHSIDWFAGLVSTMEKKCLCVCVLQEATKYSNRMLIPCHTVVLAPWPRPTELTTHTILKFFATCWYKYIIPCDN